MKTQKRAIYRTKAVSKAAATAICMSLALLCVNSVSSCSAQGFAECSDCNLPGCSSCEIPGYGACDLDASCGCQQSCCDCRPWAHRTSVWGEFLFLHPTGVDMVHAQQQNGTGGAGTVPWGTIGAADPNYEPSYRIGANFALNDCASIAASYSFLESSSINTVVPPVIPGGGGAVGSLVHHPGAGIVSSAGPLTAYYNIDYQIGDVAFRRLLQGDSRGWLNYSVGGRYAHLEEDFFQFGSFSGSQTGNITTRGGIEFDGGGARFGLDGEHVIGCRGFSCYANTAVSPVVGQFSSSYVEQNTSSTTQLANAFWKDDRFVTILDYEVGLAWTSRCGRIRVSAGYTASFWYNAVTMPGFIDAVQADNYVDLGDTISFDGLTTRAEFRF